MGDESPRSEVHTANSLVGREREQVTLRDTLSAAMAGRGGLVLIGGEAGIGKTALAQALCQEASSQGALILIGRCFDLTETPPYGPWVELLGRQRWATELPLPEAFARRGTIGEVVSQARLLEELLAFFAALAAAQPVLLFLDDAHWMDVASLELLRFLARNLAAQPLLLIATYRSDEVSLGHPLYSLLPALVRESAATRIDLRPLADEAVRTLVTARYGLEESDTGRLVTYLQARAGGNLLFLGELLRSLAEASLLRAEGERWVLDPLTDVAIPTLLRAVIDGRVARLDAQGRHLLSIAAVIGQECPFAIWATVAGLAEADLLAVVARAEAAHIMIETADGLGASFAHALIREAIHMSMRPSQRRQWHRMVAEALIAGANPDPDAIAMHFQRASDERAAEWLIAAGDRAEHAYAYLTASDRFEAALAILKEQQADPARRGWLFLRLALLHRFSDQRRSLAYIAAAWPLLESAGDPALAAYLALIRGMLRCIDGEIRQGIDDLEAGVRAISALPTTARPATLPPSLRVAIESRDGRGVLALWLGFTGRYARARSLAEELFVAGIDDPSEQLPRGDGNLGLGLAYAGLGLVEPARQALRRAAHGYVAIGNTSMIALTVVMEIHNVLYPLLTDDVAARRQLAARAEAAYARAAESVGVVVRDARLLAYPIEGDWQTAREVATAIRDSSRNRLERELARETLLFVAWRQGDTALAWDLIAEVLPDGPATEPGNSYHGFAIAAPRVAAVLALEQGEHARAREWIEAHDRWHAWSGAVVGAAEATRLWAEYWRATGSPDRAQELAEQALTQATTPRQPLVLLATHRLLGEFATADVRHAAARTHLDAALALAVACAAPFERALTLLALAECYAATGGSTEAQTLLDEARSICALLDARPALARIAALAHELESGEPSKVPDAPQFAPQSLPGGLSPREIDVLRLLAGGRSTKEVAAALGMRPRTVERHIANLYIKINALGRAEAIAFAHRHGLI